MEVIDLTEDDDCYDFNEEESNTPVVGPSYRVMNINMNFNTSRGWDREGKHYFVSDREHKDMYKRE